MDNAPPDDAQTLTVSNGTDSVTLEPARNAWLVHLAVPEEDKPRQQRMLEAAGQALMNYGGGRLEYWIENATLQSDQIPLAAGFTPVRDLWRLERPLPAPLSTLETRPYSDEDQEDFLDINNRAFAWHPEQSDMTAQQLAEKMAEPWFDPEGFLLWELDGEVAGFCWVKVHHDLKPARGEIYAIAIDPDLHGQGYGTQLTLAGLNWMTEQGLKQSILYVESDNRPANRIYSAMGFKRELINRSYQRIVR